MSEPERLLAHMRLLKTRADLDLQAFETLVEQHGNDLIWERSTICPCRNHEQGDTPKVNCSVCNGLGREYWGAQNIRGVIASLDLNHEAQLAYGQWAAGTARITVRGEHQPGFRDRYTNTQGIARFDQRATRRAPEGGLERLRYPIARADYMLHHPLAVGLDGDATAVELRATALKLADQLSRTAADAIIQRTVLRLRVLDNDTREPGAVREQGVDFDVVDGQIAWALGDQRGTAPAVGQDFGVSYLYHPRYMVTMFDHVSRDQLVVKKSPTPKLQRLLVGVIAKLDYLMTGDEGAT